MPFFTSVTVTGVTVVRVVTVAVPFMPPCSSWTQGRGPVHAGLQCVDGQLLPGDRGWEVLGNGRLPGGFRQPDGRRSAIDGQTLTPLLGARRRGLLRLRRSGRDTDDPRGQGHTNC